MHDALIWLNVLLWEKLNYLID